ncbi:MAG TPA: two-component regulator propeller domain-containing protein [Balneolaceae bacterium]|nr:two-component regulator propeller domain-containing protein [Balneolaceae bacterium]
MKTIKMILGRAVCMCSFLILAVNTNAFGQDEQTTKPTVLSSEAPAVRFEHLGVANGLAQGSGNGIMQDKEGYIWICTQGGLHRYDGHEFKIYTTVPFDTTALMSSWVWNATEAKDGDIWVTYNGSGGVSRMDRATGTFTHYRHDPKDSTSISVGTTFDVLQGSNGDLWVSTFNSGLNRMRNGQNGIFEHYRHDSDNPNSISSNELYRFNEDKDGNIWVGSHNGLNRIDPKTDKITRYLYDPKPDSLDGSHSIFRQYFSSDTPGIIWLATGYGLVRLNSKTGEYKRFLIAPNKDRTNPSNVLWDVTQDPADSKVLWVGGPGTGMARFDTRTESFTRYRHDPRDPHSLIDNQITSMLTDRSGSIWVGTAGSGLDRFNPGAVNFTNLKNEPGKPSSLAPGTVWGIYEDHSGNLWISSDAGTEGYYLNEFNKARGTVIRYQNDPHNSATLLPGAQRAFAEDGVGHFWIGGNVGLNLFNRATGYVTRFRQESSGPNQGRNSIFALLPTAADSNMLWIGSLGGLDRFNTLSRHFTHIHLTPNKEQEPVVFSLHQDADSILWAGTTSGLMRVSPDGKAGIVSAYDPHDTTKISGTRILSIAERPQERGVLWLATMSGGLNRFDTHTGIATHYTTADGLPSNALYAVMVDKSGTLWMSTNNGISNFDPDTKKFRNYGLDDGLMALEYDQNAYAKGAGGVFYFGSGEGVTAFIPEKLHINEVPPQVELSDFKISDKKITAGPHSPLKKPLAETKSITLDYNQNDVTFDFVALHFANADKNKYAYKLDGFDKDWIDSGTKSSARYTNLPPNTYTFQVKAANADGVWNNKGASIQLIILPPWYRSWWAYGLFAGLLALVVFGVDRVQRYRISRKENERAVLREAELRAEAENKRRADTEKLSKIGRAITSTLSVDEIIETVYEHVNALMDAAIFGVGIYNKEGRRLEFPATKENGAMLSPYVNHLDEDGRPAVWCFKNREEIIIGDFKNEYSKYVKEYEPPIQGDLPSSVIYLPLVHHDRVIGVITTQSFEKNAYTEYHINLLRNLATYAAIALDNAAAYRKLNATLSELQTTQQQLVQQEKLASLGQLTAGIAHEIKNPLNFVNNFSDLSIELLEEAREELLALSDQPSEALAILDDIQTNLKKIYEHGARADSIVKSMLQHSRGGSGKKEPVDLNALVKEYVNLSFHGMRASKHPINIDIAFDLDPSVGKISLISEDFSRVVINLCNNAFDAMRDKLNGHNGENADKYLPKLTAKTAKANGKILLVIEDNGPGIPEKIRNHILQPFFSTKKGSEGTGLGLSITNDIVKAHGGSMEIESEENKFTRFVISLT